MLDGLTGQQRFFMSWAAGWRQVIRNEEAIRRLATDPHSPNEFRTNAIASNLDAFHEAFGVAEQDAMWLTRGDARQHLVEDRLSKACGAGHGNWPAPLCLKSLQSPLADDELRIACWHTASLAVWLTMSVGRATPIGVPDMKSVPR